MKYLMINIKEILIALKGKLLTFLKVFVAFLLPIKPLAFLVALAILIDTVTGLAKARKLKEKITSRKLSRFISKMILYLGCLICFYALDKFLIGELIASFSSIPLLATKLVAVSLVFVELLSIDENFKAGWNYSMFGALKKMLIRAKEIKGDIDSVADTKENKTDDGQVKPSLD